VVDELSVAVKEDLSLPEGAKREVDRPVADITTHSAEAYRYYLEGVDYLYKFYGTEAKKSFKKALEFDSAFAMAYFRLAIANWGPERRRLMAKAVQYSDEVNQKERYYIGSWEAVVSGDYSRAMKELQRITERFPDEKEALYWIGRIHYSWRQFEEALRYYSQAVELDPLYKLAYSDLAHTYDRLGDYEKSIWAVNKYISLTPDEANPYDVRGGLYAGNGKIDQAIESFKKALEMKPDFYRSWWKLGHMHLFRREYAEAESCYQKLLSSSDKRTRSEGRTYLAYIPLHQGRFGDALEILDHGIAADRMEQYEEDHTAFKYLLKASIYAETKSLNLALREAETWQQFFRKVYPHHSFIWRDVYACILAEGGEIAEAEEVARALKKDIEREDTSLVFGYRRVVGAIELAKGNAELAVTYLEKAAEKPLFFPLFWVRFLLAKAYMESGALGDAVAELEQALSRYDDSRADYPIWTVKAHYLLGLAYEKSGWNKKAIEQYKEFLEIWRDADPGIPEMEEAKERLEKLRVKSRE
jgi:tetratricopeptide (TPR) repeat protein